MKTHVLTAILSSVIFPLSASASDWWTTLSDTTLNSLEERALDANYDVDAAMRRVQVAQHQLTAARSGYFPTIGLSAGWEKERRSPSQWSVGADMSWEIDLFGRVRANANQKKAQIRASRADLEGSRLSVAASVAQAYVSLRSYQEQLALARSQAADQKKVAEMVQARYDAGLADRLDVAQALTTYHSTCASIPGLQTSVEQSLTALSVLLAIPPANLTYLMADSVLPSAANLLLPAEVAADDVRSRPDIIAAEAQIDAAAAALGIARKDYLPTLSLTGSVATAAHGLGDLFTNESFTYSIAPTLSWTLFDGLERRANTAAAKEQMQIAVDEYNESLCSAYQEVQNALTAYVNTSLTVKQLSLTVDQADIALEKSIALYKLDLENFTSVMQSQMSVLTYRTQLIEQRANILDSFIKFHKATGR